MKVFSLPSFRGLFLEKLILLFLGFLYSLHNFLWILSVHFRQGSKLCCRLCLKSVCCGKQLALFRQNPPKRPPALRWNKHPDGLSAHLKSKSWLFPYKVSKMPHGLFPHRLTYWFFSAHRRLKTKIRLRVFANILLSSQVNYLFPVKSYFLAKIPDDSDHNIRFLALFQTQFRLYPSTTYPKVFLKV